jgi:hypothetical protein
LQALESGRSPDDHPVRLELWKLRSRIIREFYQSPAGLAMLGYTPPFPAGYPDYNRPPSF